MSHRKSIRRQFRPSEYSTGVRPISLSSEAYGSVRDIFLPAWAEGWFGDNEEDKEPTAGSMALDYWWVLALGAPFLYISINRGLDFLGGKD